MFGWQNMKIRLGYRISTVNFRLLFHTRSPTNLHVIICWELPSFFHLEPSHFRLESWDSFIIVIIYFFTLPRVGHESWVSSQIQSYSGPKPSLWPVPSFFFPYGIKKSFLNTIQIKGTPTHRFLIYLYLNFIFSNFIQYPDVIICMRQWKRA